MQESCSFFSQNPHKREQARWGVACSFYPRGFRNTLQNYCFFLNYAIVDTTFLFLKCIILQKMQLQNALFYMKWASQNALFYIDNFLPRNFFEQKIIVSRIFILFRFVVSRKFISAKCSLSAKNVGLGGGRR